MSERKKFFNNPITVRFSNDEYTLREEQFAEMFPDLEPDGITNRVVFNNLFDRAFNNFRKSNESRKQDLDTIEQLNNEIGRLKIEIDLKESDFAAFKETAKEIHDSYISCHNELSELKASKPVLSENQLLIHIPPIVGKVLEIEAATAKRKTGKEYSYEDVLMQSFWDSVKVGRAFPWNTWSSSELSKIATDLKAAKQ